MPRTAARLKSDEHTMDLFGSRGAAQRVQRVRASAARVVGLLPGEICCDSFAGGGGVSEGIKLALGRAPDVAINHDPEAISMHRANHPNTHHYCENVWRVRPNEACHGRPVGLFWLSPDCKHHSKAKGGKPKDRKIRGLANLAIYWAKEVRPRVIVLENVEEFQKWGPLLPTGQPCPVRQGTYFRRFVNELRSLGYAVEWNELRACDYGAPTTRKRLFLIARCDGLPIVWPEPTHGPGLLPYRTAAEIIDWSIPCPSIFLSKEEGAAIGVKRPLVEASLRRIARGVKKFVVDDPNPFIVTMRGTQDSHIEQSSRSIHDPLRTISAQGNHHVLVAPTLIQVSWGERVGQEPRVPGLHKPLGTVMAGGIKHGLVAAFLAKHYGGNESPGWPVNSPISTITARDHHSLVYAFLAKYYGTDQDPKLTEPLHTITTKDRFALVTVRGQKYRIEDIGMRLLTPAELYRAQSFPDDYIIDRGLIASESGEEEWTPLSKTAQVRMCGNSVPPVLVKAIISANFGVSEPMRVAA